MEHTVEPIANWMPLEGKLSPELCAEFMWMFRENGVEHYKHIATRRYLRLDGDGRCLAWTDKGLKEVPFEQEWKRVSGRAGRGGNTAAARCFGWREIAHRKAERRQ